MDKCIHSYCRQLYYDYYVTIVTAIYCKPLGLDKMFIMKYVHSNVGPGTLFFKQLTEHLSLSVFSNNTKLPPSLKRPSSIKNKCSLAAFVNL